MIRSRRAKRSGFWIGSGCEAGVTARFSPTVLDVSTPTPVEFSLSDPLILWHAGDRRWLAGLQVRCEFGRDCSHLLIMLGRARTSTPFFWIAKTWMAGTSPAMTT